MPFLTRKTGGPQRPMHSCRDWERVLEWLGGGSIQTLKSRGGPRWFGAACNAEGAAAENLWQCRVRERLDDALAKPAAADL